MNSDRPRLGSALRVGIAAAIGATVARMTQSQPVSFGEIMRHAAIVLLLAASIWYGFETVQAWRSRAS